MTYETAMKLNEAFSKCFNRHVDIRVELEGIKVK